MTTYQAYIQHYKDKHHLKIKKEGDEVESDDESSDNSELFADIKEEMKKKKPGYINSIII